MNGQVGWFYLKSVFFSTNHKEDHIMEKTDMPDELVRNVQGEQIFQQTLLQVLVLTHWGWNKIATISQKTF